MSKRQAPPPDASTWPRGFAALFGLFLALTLLKFGNPVVLEFMVSTPQDMAELTFASWPIIWGHMGLFILVLCGLKLARFSHSPPRWLMLMPLIWLGWQMLASAQTIDRHLSWVVMKHFVACVALFYTGSFILAKTGSYRLFWGLLVSGFLMVLFRGFQQHYGELEMTRHYVEQYVDPASITPEMRARMASDRIYSTLVYPNALAGVILMLLPLSVAWVWEVTTNWHKLAGAILTGLVAYGGIACLAWSGSKAGWLIAIVLGLVILLQVPFKRAFKAALVGGLLVGGLTVFFLKYQDYFSKGAKSLSARLTYWEAALKVTKENPILGTGPGTFSVNYKKIKAPEAEMARLAHNDYLEQACDSGVPGFSVYLVAIIGLLVQLYRKSQQKFPNFEFFVWIGLLGFALQGFVEFGLYVPAISWVAFALLGWLCGQVAIPLDTGKKVM